MSIQIIAKFYFRDSRPPVDEVLCTLVNSFVSHPQARQEFLDMNVYRDRSKVGHEHGPLTVDEVCRFAEGTAESDKFLSVGSSIRCWRFSPGKSPESSGVVLSFESWGDEWGKRHYTDLRVCGQASITVYKAGAFQAFIEKLDDPYRQEVNTRVEENLEGLTKLLMDAVNVLRPSSMKVYTDETLYLPFNAHVAYYRDEMAVIEDLQLIADIWQGGLPTYNGVPPLREKIERSLSTYLGDWRTPEQREKLLQKLNAVLPPRPMPTAEDVRAVWSSGRFDNYEMPVGILLLDYPHYMNAYLDRFYWEVLERASAKVPATA